MADPALPMQNGDRARRPTRMVHMKTYGCRYSGGAWEDPLPELGEEPVLGFAFGSTAFLDNPGVFEELTGRYPGLSLVGCSSAGEILGSEITDDTVVVALVTFSDTCFSVVHEPVTSVDDSAAVGERLARRLLAPGLRGVAVFSDGLGVNGTELARGMNETTPADTVVSGGLAGDGDRFERTWVLVDGKPASGYVCAVGFYGDHIEFRYGSEGGWGPFGPTRKVTRSEGNVLLELDGQPALELYKTYLGERAAGLPATALLFPLQIEGTGGRTLVRTVLAVDEDAQSMTFAGDIPEGGNARLMRASFDSLVDGAEAAASQARTDEPTLCVAVSCVGRRLVLGEGCEEEVEATATALPPGSLQVGFYSYGELAPTGFLPCDLHNQTMTLTTIVEHGTTLWSTDHPSPTEGDRPT